MSWRSLSRLLSNLKGAYNDINPSTLTGAIDVLVVEQPDGSFTSGPFHVRFGKLTAISPADKTVEVYVNGQYVDFLHMQLGSAGEAYFVEPSESDRGREEHTRLTEDEVIRTHWPPVTSRRRRRRVRRDTAQSESDMGQPEYEELFDDGPQSDCEQSTSLTPDCDSRVTHFISDSMLHGGFLSSSQDLQWDWGNFPQRKSEGLLNVSSSDLDADLPPAPTRKSETVLPQLSPPVPTSEGVYLEDLVTAEVDQTVKEAYIYPPARNLSRSPRSRVHQDSSGCVDAGYRSDGEHSPRSISPIYPSVFGLRLSLCGWPSLGSKLSEEKFFEHLVSYEEFIQDPEAIMSNPNLTVQLNGKFMNWPVAAPSILSILAYQSELPHCVVRRLENLHMRKKEIRRTSWFSWGSRSTDTTVEHVPTDSTISPLSQLPQLSEQEPAEQNNLKQIPSISVPDHNTPVTTHVKREIRRYNRLSSEEISRLNLRHGRNDIEFRVTTKIQGTCVCSASIFVWHWTDRIVISDVDGTITRSDLLGHLLPMLGHDWTHFGVANLYNLISRNGYRFVYVSTRALGQAGITRSYLRHVHQNNQSLPEGPILLSPNSLLHAFHQEVIEKKPENFKIQCLLDVCALFPSDHPPFYAGFGNKTNDAFAYEKAGIDRCRIFTINPRGEVRNEFHPAKTTSYTELSQLVDHYFPLITKQVRQQPTQSITDMVQSNTTSTQKVPTDSSQNFIDSNIDMSRYSCFTYWRTPDFEPCEASVEQS